MTRWFNAAMPSAPASRATAMKSRTLTGIPLILLILIIAGPGCARGDDTERVVAVSILPQKYLVDRIAGGRFAVTVIIPPGFSHESVEITTGQVKAASRALIYYRIGPLPFEDANMARFTQANPGMTVVDTSAGAELIRGHNGKGHGGADPHLWLSPVAVKIMARHIKDALAKADPEGKDSYEKNYHALAQDIDDMDRRIEKILAPYKGRKFLVFHPAWSYFAQHYGLKQMAVEQEGKTPGPQHIKELIDTAKKEGIRVIFIQRQFPSQAAETVAKDIGGTVAELDPLAPDWMIMMKSTAEAIRDAMKNRP